MDYIIKKSPKPRPPRSTKKYVIEVRTFDGGLRPFTPKDALWYIMYIFTSSLDARAHRQF